MEQHTHTLTHTNIQTNTHRVISQAIWRHCCCHCCRIDTIRALSLTRSLSFLLCVFLSFRFVFDVCLCFLCLCTPRCSRSSAAAVAASTAYDNCCCCRFYNLVNCTIDVHNQFKSELHLCFLDTKIK